MIKYTRKVRKSNGMYWVSIPKADAEVYNLHGKTVRVEIYDVHDKVTTPSQEGEQNK
jgi:hypothetical protein